MNNSKKLATESNAETLRLHALMQKRNKDALQAAEEMLKHPLSLEQQREQVQRLAKRAGLSDGKNISKPLVQPKNS